MRGNFLVLEGIDGCGKTTQINHLANWLPNSGLMPVDAKLHLTREPGGTALGAALRELLLNPPDEISPEPISELLLYAADRAQHISQFILPNLRKGDWVLSDRFSGSTLAYQGYGRNLNLEIIHELEKIATNGLTPDLTLWLHLPLKTSLLRRGAKPNDRIEAEGEEFLAKVSLGFETIAKERNWSKIPGELEASLVSKRIEEELQKFFLPRFQNQNH